MILLAAIVGTTLMTLFSYLLTRWSKHEFYEPELLASLISRMPRIHVKKKISRIAGYIIHYIIGYLFIFAYASIWVLTELNQTVLFGIIAGFINGVVGFLVWKITFALHPNPPETHLTKFAWQLIIAHVIFGLSATMTLKLLF